MVRRTHEFSCSQPTYASHLCISPIHMKNFDKYFRILFLSIEKLFRNVEEISKIICLVFSVIFFLFNESFGQPLISRPEHGVLTKFLTKLILFKNEKYKYVEERGMFNIKHKKLNLQSY